MIESYAANYCVHPRELFLLLLKRMVQLPALGKSSKSLKVNNTNVIAWLKSRFVGCHRSLKVLI